MKQWLLFFVSLIASCSKAIPNSTPLERASFIDITRLSGDWVVAAHIPTLLDGDGENMRATIQRAQNGVMDVQWSFRRSAGSDKETHWNLKIHAGPGAQSTLWQISPFWPIKFSYQINEFAGDYSWLVLSSADRRYLWVLSRQAMSPELLNGLRERLIAANFDMSAIVPQPSPAP